MVNNLSLLSVAFLATASEAALDCRQNTLALRFNRQVADAKGALEVASKSKFFTTACEAKATVYSECPVFYNTLAPTEAASYKEACDAEGGEVASAGLDLICMVKGYCIPADGCVPNVKYAIKDVPDCVMKAPEAACHPQASAVTVVESIKKEMEAMGYVCVTNSGSVQRMSLIAGGVALLASYFF